MVNDWFGVHDGLAGAARFPSLVRTHSRISALELILLLSCGAAAAAAAGYVKLSLRIPGHSIVLSALPMVLGLALAPRRLAGSVMSAGAIGTAWLLSGVGGASYGSGSAVSLLLIGPMMDVAVRHARGQPPRDAPAGVDLPAVVGKTAAVTGTVTVEKRAGREIHVLAITTLKVVADRCG